MKGGLWRSRDGWVWGQGRRGGGGSGSTWPCAPHRCAGRDGAGARGLQPRGQADGCTCRRAQQAGLVHLIEVIVQTRPRHPEGTPAPRPHSWELLGPQAAPSPQDPSVALRSRPQALGLLTLLALPPLLSGWLSASRVFWGLGGGPLKQFKLWCVAIAHMAPATSPETMVPFSIPLHPLCSQTQVPLSA